MTKAVVCHDINGKKYEVKVQDLRWRPSAYGIIIRDDKVLLVPQFDGYDLPGGGIELGETPEQAVTREVKEETGIDILKPKLLAAENSFFKSIHSTPQVTVQGLMLYYDCEYGGGNLSTEGFDEFEKQYAHLAQWVPLSKLAAINVKHSYDWRKLVKKVAVSS